MRFLSISTVRTGLLLLVMGMPAWGADTLEQSISKAGKGDITAMYQAGVEILNGKRPDSTRALSYLEKVSADTSSALQNKAKVWLGRPYRDELAGTVKNLKKSFGYFEQAAGKQGKDPEAQYELGKAYFTGAGTDRNLIAAYMWTSLSLHKESPVSQQGWTAKTATD